jgi:hypothetical protein
LCFEDFAFTSLSISGTSFNVKCIYTRKHYICNSKFGLRWGLGVVWIMKLGLRFAMVC